MRKKVLTLSIFTFTIGIGWLVHWVDKWSKATDKDRHYE